MDLTAFPQLCADQLTSIHPHRTSSTLYESCVGRRISPESGVFYDLSHLRTEN